MGGLRSAEEVGKVSAARLCSADEMIRAVGDGPGNGGAPAPVPVDQVKDSWGL